MHTVMILASFLTTVHTITRRRFPMSNARKLLVLFVLSAAIRDPMSVLAAPPYSGASTVDYRLLIDGQVLPNGGFRVVYVDPQGPGMHVMSNRGLLALEPGDMITTINGRPIFHPHDLHRELAQSGGREVSLTVVDYRSGELLGCRVFPARISRDAFGPVWPGSSSLRPIQPADPAGPTPVTAIKALVIAQTTDPGIATSTTISMQRVYEALRKIPYVSPQDIQVLSGSDVQADRILDTISAMSVGPTDVVFCYYTGHGAYYPRGANNDPSGGHFFQLPTGDLPRKTLMGALLAKSARLTVLVSDSCNVSSASGPITRRRSLPVWNPSYRELETLLRGYAGVVDMNGSSQDQSGWGSDDLGGWFTDAFLSAAKEQFTSPNAPTWPEFVTRVSDRTSMTFGAKKSEILSRPAYDWASSRSRDAIWRQPDQRPQVFVLNVYPTP